MGRMQTSSAHRRDQGLNSAAVLGHHARAPIPTHTIFFMNRPLPWKDITMPLRNGMVNWPGDAPFAMTRDASMERGDVCNLSRLSLSAHTGTHMDAPRHFIADGATMEQMPLDTLIGTCRVIELECAEQITPHDLLPHDIKRGQRVLFKTRNSARDWSGEAFDTNFVSIRKDAAEYLVERGVRLVGVDYLSIGGYEKDGVETHQIILGAGICVIEGLRLQGIHPGKYDMICLPMKIEGADGAPCRVVIR